MAQLFGVASVALEDLSWEGRIPAESNLGRRTAADKLRLPFR